jgi:hypothetical protein
MSSSDRHRQKQIRQRVIKRDGLICCFCAKELKQDEHTLDHLIPASQNGPFWVTNLTVACSPCNNKRGHRNFFEFAVEQGMKQDKLAFYFALFAATSQLKILRLMLVNYSRQHKIPRELAATAHKQLLRDYPAFCPIALEPLLKNWKKDCRSLRFSWKLPSSKKALKQVIQHLTNLIEGKKS